MIIRFLLEKCATAREAADRLLSLPVLEPKSYLIADKSEAFAAEIHPERKELRGMEDNVLAVTNHYVHPSMGTLQPEWPNSVARYERLVRGGKLIAGLGAPAAREELRKLMEDHDAPLCGHEDGLATFWSCVGSPAERSIAYSMGAPCRNPYREVCQSR